MAEDNMDVDNVVDIEKENDKSISTTSKSHHDLPWVEKYRPKNLDELIAHEEIISTLNKLIESNRIPHLLFHGPPGTGKTSTIIACAKKMFGTSYNAMTLELNASDERGIEVVRNQIKEFAGTRKFNLTSSTKTVKLIILDEADAMTNDAQSALRRVMEKYSSNTRFCMICNYVNKIIPALQSRCTRFRFAPLRPEQIISRLEEVCTAEKVNSTESGRQALLQLSGGDMRRVLNLLQSTHMAYPQVTEESVYLTAGAALPSVIESIFQCLLNDNFQTAYDKIFKVITDFGYALCDINTELSILLSKVVLPDSVIAHIVDKMSTIEYRLSHGVPEKIEVGALVGAFIVGREMMKNSIDKK
jgi:replication factor C subunit 3/5